jgi:hypothetical protein
MKLVLCVLAAYLAFGPPAASGYTRVEWPDHSARQHNWFVYYGPTRSGGQSTWQVEEIAPLHTFPHCVFTYTENRFSANTIAGRLNQIHQACP